MSSKTLPQQDAKPATIGIGIPQNTPKALDETGNYFSCLNNS